MSTCRLCKKCNYETVEPLFKYGPRHSVHASCGFKKWGAAFIDKIHPNRLGQLPYLMLSDMGLLDEVRRRMADYEKSVADRSKKLLGGGTQ